MPGTVIALFRGRYRGRLIDDAVYWETVLRYVDLNPVRAGLCRAPGGYPHGSAAIYCGADGPAWLSRGKVHTTIEAAYRRAAFGRSDYERFATVVDPEVLEYVVERRMGLARRTASPPMDDLVRAASLRYRGWFEWKTDLADGTRPGLVLVPPRAVTRVLRSTGPLLSGCSAPSQSHSPTARADISRVAAAALYRDLCGLRLREISDRLGVAGSTVHAALERHRRLLADVEGYADALGRVASLIVRRALPPPVRALSLPPRTAMEVGAEAEEAKAAPAVAISGR